MQFELFSKEEGSIFKDIERIDVAEILDLDGNKRFPLLRKNRFILYRTGCKDSILYSWGNIFPGIYNKKSGKFIKAKLRGAQDYRTWLMVQFTNDVRQIFDSDCHRLIALAFIENSDPKNKIMVNHKDHNKVNYLPENLEWVSRRENTLTENVDKGVIKRREQALREKYNA